MTAASFPQPLIAFVRLVDRMNYGVGRFAMYLLFALMAVLMWSSISKAFFHPSLWTLEMAQFVMVAYYVLGGPYAMQMGTHVRMDLFYARQSPKTRAVWDGFTVFAVAFYLAVLIWGAAESFGWMFEALGLGLICETAALDNVATQRLLDGLGFRRMGEVTSLRSDGTSRASLVWEMTRSEWEGRHDKD